MQGERRCAYRSTQCKGLRARVARACAQECACAAIGRRHAVFLLPSCLPSFLPSFLPSHKRSRLLPPQTAMDEYGAKRARKDMVRPAVRWYSHGADLFGQADACCAVTCGACARTSRGHCLLGCGGSYGQFRPNHVRTCKISRNCSISDPRSRTATS